MTAGASSHAGAPSPDAARRITLARHGETAWTGHRYAGHADVPLTEAGRVQAQALAERIVAVGLLADPRSVVVASPLVRALDTARAVAEQAGRNLVVDARWREVDFGAFEGRTFNEVAAERPDVAARLLAHDSAIDWPDGEPFEAFRSRIAAAWADVIALAVPALVVSHGIAIRTAVAIATGRASTADGVLGPTGTISLCQTATGWAVETAEAAGADHGARASSALPAEADVLGAARARSGTHPAERAG